jgi:signal transduction histidine kinase
LNSYRIKRLLKILLLLFALSIAFISLWYTNNLVDKLKVEEQIKAQTWADATKLLANADLDAEALEFPLSIVAGNNTIPVIVTDGEGGIIDYRNLDTLLVKDPSFFVRKIKQMESLNDPIEVDYAEGQKMVIYYENTILLTKLTYYPLIQLLIIGIFLAMSYFAFSYSRRSEQNQVWVGMSKETAHQLGTPISSLMAWMQVINDVDHGIDEQIILEMQNDVNRLELITERFSKIGSEPVIKEVDVQSVIQETVGYLEKRSSTKVEFVIETPIEHMTAELNVPLFAWVLENLTKNAIDAMSGEGQIKYQIFRKSENIYIEITDTGIGIGKNDFKTIFKPGFTTKKRGWGLGLSLAKRIVEEYHRGKIMVVESIPFEKTTFRIVLKTAPL